MITTQPPPNDLDAEMSVLGACLESREAIADVIELLTPEDFYKPEHAVTFRAIASLYGASQPVDLTTVADEIARLGGEVSKVYLFDLTRAYSTASSAPAYAAIVTERSKLRSLASISARAYDLAHSNPESADEAVDRVQGELLEIGTGRTKSDGRSLKSLLPDVLGLVERRSSGELVGLATGFGAFDEMTGGLQPGQLYFVGARPSMGKALALDTYVPTPTGSTIMGDLQVGDEVLDESGSPCRVTYTSPIFLGNRCYEVTFDDGTVVVADADHRWFVYDAPAWKSLRERARCAARPPKNPQFAGDQSSRWIHPRVVTTSEMAGAQRAPDGRPNWYTLLADPLALPDMNLSVDPYVLGAWLGDGDSANARITGIDSGIFEEIEAAGYPLTAHKVVDRCPVYGIGGGLQSELRKLGVLGNKRIPEIYQRASEKQRRALLEGLMDTDGTVTNRNGTVEICLSKKDLLEDVRELVCGLGYKAGPIRKRSIRLDDGRLAFAWRFGWTPLDSVFRLQRKTDRILSERSTRLYGRARRRAITDIREVPSLPTRCIAVDSPNHLFLVTTSFIPTHNTAWALQVALSVAERGNPALMCSLEMSQEDLVIRLLASRAGVDSQSVKSGHLSGADWERMSKTAGELADAPFVIDDSPHVTIMNLRAKARRMKATTGLSLLVIDYLGLLQLPNAENQNLRVSEMSRQLKLLARDLEVPVVCAVQLNRGLESRPNKRPVLSDLRDSGSLEQDGDLIAFLYRDAVYHDDTKNPRSAELIVAKQRNGPIGTVTLDWNARFTRFASVYAGRDQSI